MFDSSQSSVHKGRVAGLSAALALVFTMLPLCGFAAAAADDIEIVATRGDVEVSMDGVALAARAGSTLDLPAELRTGHDGSADLRQGPTTIGVGPDTKLSFPAPAASGTAIDRVVQPLGNAFYSVGPRGKDRLRVETPYLVAVIKGTQFNVVVDEESSTISLFEGSLEVLATDGDAMVMLSAGEIAIRRRGDETITVIRMKDHTIASSGAKGGKGKDGEPTNGTPGTTTAGPVAGIPGVPTPTGADVSGGVDVDLPVLPVDPVEGKVKLAIGGDGDGLAIDAGVAIGAGPVGVAAGVDVGIDAGAGTVDVGVDASVGVGPVGVDLGVDAGVDLGAGTVDVGVDAAVDAGPVAVDLGVGAGVDLGAGTVDVGVDAGIGLGPVGVDLAADAGLDAGAGIAGAEVNAGALGADVGVGVAVDLAGPDAGVDLGVDLLGAEIDLGVDLGLGLDLGLGTDTSAPDTAAPPADSGGGLGGLLGGLLGRPRP